MSEVNYLALEMLKEAANLPNSTGSMVSANHSWQLK